MSQCEKHVGKLMAMQSEYDIISHHLFSKINSELLISTSNQWWKWTWSQILMNCVISPQYVCKKLMRVKTTLCPKIFILLSWEILVRRKCIKWATYVLITQENFGMKLFRFHRWEHFLSRNNLSAFHYIL